MSDDSKDPPKKTPANGNQSQNGKLLLTVKKYDSGTAQLLPGGKLAPTPPQLKASQLGIIRAYLLKDGYLEKHDGNKPFCTKDGIEVTDDITFYHYVEENSEANTPAASTTVTAKEDGKSTKHDIYILTKKRDAKVLDPNIDAFLRKPLDISNDKKVDFPTASTGASLTSSFNSSSWAAEASESIIHPADMTENEWGIVMRNNNLLSGQFLQKGPVEKIIRVPGHEDITRPGIGVSNVEKAYYSAFALKPKRLPEYDITFATTKSPVEQIKGHGIELPDHSFRIPRFHIKDASKVRVFETKGSLETAMAESSFSEDSIDVAVSGSAFGISAAAKAGAAWNNDEKSASSRFKDTDYMHVVYEFPRVELILNEENLELSNECQADIQNLRHRRTLKELDHFEKRYGTFFTRHVHLGGKLVSIDESDTVAGANTSEKTKMLKAAAGASVAGFGFQAEVNYSHTENSGTQSSSTEKKMTHSMSWSAEGGDTTLCNNPPKWCPTVTSFYNWRVMKQGDVINIYELIGKLHGYEDIPSLVTNILHINPDPKSLVQFSLRLLPDAEEHGERELYFCQPKDKNNIAQLNMDPALQDPHSLQSHQRERISELTFKPKTAQGLPYGTAFGVPISADQSNIFLEESKMPSEKDILYPRVKYGVKYPVHYILDEDDSGEKTSSLYTLQIGGDAYSNRFLYGEHDKAANVMVEFSGEKKKKNTPVEDHATLRLHFSYIHQDATIPHVSNFRFIDIDDSHMKEPHLEDLKRKIMNDLPPKPQKPPELVIPPYFLDNKLGGSARSDVQAWALNFARQEHDRHVKSLTDAYGKKMEKYKKEKEDYDQKVHQTLEEACQKVVGAYGRLKEEWDNHEKVMNQFVPFEKMSFQVNYCNLENKTNYVAQKHAAEAALNAEKEAKAKELAEELAKEVNEKAKEAKAEAIEKDHKERLKKRVEFLLKPNRIACGFWFVTVNPMGNWLFVKPKLERVKRLMDSKKAEKLGVDIQNKDNAIARLAEYDLESDELDALIHISENPFFKDATAKVEIPL